MNSQFYLALADAVLLAHLLYIAWVIFGALFTRGRPLLGALHIATIIWGIITETTPAPCPLTTAENWSEARAGVMPYHGPFLLHYLDATVYPNVPAALLITVAVIVCALNLLVYARRIKNHHSLG
ncbi:MAG TPA: DUF2784 domain-containing protein [Candidatus Acidoferrales bacterium]|nr:DUF2784 domain-containing protein [Candidatus Acidoferrales bacterium]